MKLISNRALAGVNAPNGGRGVEEGEMAVATNIGFNLSHRTATRERRPAVPRRSGRPVRRAGGVDGRRPAGLVAAPHHVAAQPCEPRTATGSIGWLLLVAGLSFLVVLGVGWIMGGQSAGSAPRQPSVVQVHQGDTLSTVAERMAPGAAASVTVQRIRQFNHLDVDSVVYPGELLRVPNDLSPAAGAVQH
jgi:hypothetical protein